jgi:predicted nuclease of predicted toxin-antitoxin system
VRFLVDAQLPARLSTWLNEHGHDSLHTSALPDGNRTSDTEIASLADADDRVVVTKDRDFRDSHLLRGAPRHLLVVATGNITNIELMAAFDQHLATIVSAFDEADMVEFRPDQLITRPRPTTESPQ